MTILAYGSLMNQKSLEKTLQRKTQLTPITVPNTQRRFNAPFGDYAFLNIGFDDNCSIEAAYFELGSNEVGKFAEREEGAELIEVLPSMYAFIWPVEYCQELPVLQSYIDVCTSGCRELGISFWPGTNMPEKIIDDSSRPLYQ